MKTRYSFFRFFMNSIDNNVGKTNFSAFLFPAIIALVVWILLASTGLQEAFKSIANLQEMMDVWQSSENISNYMDENEKSSNSSWWDGFTSLFSSDETPESMSPFIRSLIVNTCTILAMILFLVIVCKYNHQSTKWKEVIVTTGTSSIPLTCGMFLGYVLFKIASKLESENLQTIFYLMGGGAVATSAMTAFIILYVNISEILMLKNRKTYYTIIFTVFLVIIMTASMTDWLSQK